MGVSDRLRRLRAHGPSSYEPRVHQAVLAGEVSWSQPFHWGLLTAFDDERSWGLPADVGSHQVVATSTCVAVPVLHAQDVEIDECADTNAPMPEAEVEVVLTDVPLDGPVDFVGELQCRSGRLAVGDADEYHVVAVVPGVHRVQVRLEPKEHAKRVVFALVLSR